jgi:regulator of nucleoside diphosphate kinase
MNAKNIIITNDDRRRLGTMLESPQVRRLERIDDLHALEAELECALGLDSTEVPQDVVTMDSRVALHDLASGEVETYTLVYPERADIARNCISILAPIGTAIFGCQAGDVVKVKTPSGVRHIRIEEILFQPERAEECRC